MKERSSTSSDHNNEEQAAVGAERPDAGFGALSKEERREEIETAIYQVLSELLDEDEALDTGRRPLDGATDPPGGAATASTDRSQPRENRVASQHSWTNQAIMIAVFVVGLMAMALVGRAYVMGYVP